MYIPEIECPNCSGYGKLKKVRNEVYICKPVYDFAGSCGHKFEHKVYSNGVSVTTDLDTEDES